MTDGHDLGLAHDLATLRRQDFDRRALLRCLMGAGAATVVGCGGGGDSAVATTATGSTSTGTAATGTTSTGSTGSTSSTSTASTSCSTIPEETAGPDQQTADLAAGLPDRPLQRDLRGGRRLV